MSHGRKKCEETGGRASTVEIGTSGGGQWWTRLRESRTSRKKTPSNPFSRKEDVIETAPSSHCPRQRRSTSPRSRTSSGTQHTPHLCTTATVAKAKESVKGDCKLIKTKLPERPADPDDYRRLSAASSPYMLGEVRQNADTVRIQPMDKEWIKTLQHP